MRLNFDTDWFNNNKRASENYLFLNVMVNFVIVNQKLTGSTLQMEKIRLYLIEDNDSFNFLVKLFW